MSAFPVISHISSLGLFICLLLAAFVGEAQVCKPEHSVYFQYNSSEIAKGERAELIKKFEDLDLEVSYKVELICSTDSIASSRFNQRLGDARGTSVGKLLLDLGVKLHSIEVVNNGEANPKFSNGDEEGRSQNRRVDIVMFPVNEGNITVYGSSGTSITISASYFDPCSICEANPRIKEILTDQQAADAGIPMTTVDGMELVTGGMVQLDFDCPNLDTDSCYSAEVRFPITTPDPDDTLMGVWESIETPQGVRWTKVPNRPCTAFNGYLITYLECFQSGGTIVPKYNCDVPKCSIKIFTPSLVRVPDADVAKGYEHIIKDTTSVERAGQCYDSTFRIYDVGITKNGHVATYMGSLGDTKTGDREFTIPIEAYAISIKTKMSFPSLEREQNPVVTYGEQHWSFSALEMSRGVDTDSLIRGVVHDKGFDTNAILYTLDQNISEFEDISCPDPFNSCFVIPLSAYNKTIFRYDSIYVIKTPKRFVTKTQLLVTPIDSVLALDQFKSSRNGEFKMPKHPTKFLFTVRGRDSETLVQLPTSSKAVRQKYKKRKGYFKLKVRKRRVKKVVSRREQ